MTGCDWQKNSQHQYKNTWYQSYGKRLIDIILATILFISLLPVMIMLGFWIRHESTGPIIYRQKRIGYQGKSFVLYKFRTMLDHASEHQAEFSNLNEATGPFFKIKNDPRITKSGHWLRMYSLDELPQLWNVMTGDMSLVGPRPILESELAQFEPWMCQRFDVRPGITGLWQVTDHKNNLSFTEWLQRDIDYVAHVTLNQDCWIIWETFKVVFHHDNA